MSLPELLINAQSPDNSTRESAFATLQQQKTTHPVNYLIELSTVLATQGSLQSRQLAGLELKNLLKNTTRQEALQTVWDSVPAEGKNTVKQNVVGSLADDRIEIRRSAAQAVAAVAKQELSRGTWLEIIDNLTVNASNVNQSFRMASLMTLGYICDDLSPTHMPASKVNEILTVIAQGISDSSPEIAVISLRALRNCLVFAERNIAVASERDYLLQLVGTSCSNPLEQIRTEGLIVLCEIVNKYYDVLAGHIQDIANVTFNIVQSDQNTPVILAIEVWNLIADIELERSENLTRNKQSKGLISAIADRLIQLLLTHITRMEENSEEWDISKSCASTLTVVFQITKDKHMELPSKLVQEKLLADNWKLQKAACLVLGSMLDGPSPAKLRSLVASSVPSLIRILANSPEEVRESAAWAVSKICELHCKVVTQSGFFNSVVPALCSLLQSEPKIACHSCWAFINFIENSAETGLFKLPVFEHVIKALYSATQRGDSRASEHNLQDAAFSAIATLIEKAPEDCRESILASIDGFVDLLGLAINSHDNLQNSL